MIAKKGAVRPITIGLLLMIVLICVTIVTVLSMTTAASDLRLAAKYGESIQDMYQLEAEAQSWLANTDTRIQSGEITDQALQMTFGSQEQRHLEVVVVIEDHDYQIESWRWVMPEVAETTLDHLWKGE